jgi:hypothetical protein
MQCTPQYNYAVPRMLHHIDRRLWTARCQPLWVLSTAATTATTPRQRGVHHPRGKPPGMSAEWRLVSSRPSLPHTSVQHGGSAAKLQRLRRLRQLHPLVRPRHSLRVRTSRGRTCYCASRPPAHRESTRLHSTAHSRDATKAFTSPPTRTIFTPRGSRAHSPQPTRPRRRPRTQRPGLAHVLPLRKWPNTADQLRSGAHVHPAGGGTGRHLSSPYGCRPELRQLHPLVGWPRALPLVPFCRPCVDGSVPASHSTPPRWYLRSCPPVP